ncbi:MAG: protein BatD [Bacteroidales bacterium]|nr:protein BatD [Bacteroidales bacterium]
MKKTSILITLLLLSVLALAQEMTVQAPKQVYVGDHFTVRFIVNAKASDFRGPDFAGFKVHSGPAQSSQNSVSIVNGQMSQSSTTTFSYSLYATGEGNFFVGTASCNAGGKKLESKSFSIKVEKMSQAQQQQRQQQQQQQQRQAYDPWTQQPQPASQIDDTKLFARTSISNPSPYQGEQIIITYKVYTQVPLREVGIDKLPGNKGFWAEDLSAGKQIKQYEETLDGQRYQVAEIRKGALFAQESGRLTIAPLDLNVLAMVQAPRRRTGSIWDLFDDPFFNMAQAVEYPLHTRPVTVNVKRLPPSPTDFSGAVGSFNIKGGLNTDRVKSNEALSYRLTVSGSGNLMLITPPTPDFPSTFEVYDPQMEDNLKKGDNGVSGSRTYEWVLIPRSQGKYKIPAYKFIYFDPSTQQYVTHTIEAQEVQVDKGAATASSFSHKDDVRLLNQDINYIHPVGALAPIRTEDHAGTTYWVLLALIPLLAVCVVVWGKKRQAARQDIAGLRLKRATRMARRRLKKASAYLGPGDTSRFYEEIYKAIWGCLADKYNIELSQLNRDTVSACLEEKSVHETVRERIMKVLQDVDLARFAPGDAEAQKQSIYTEALMMIAEL